MDTGEGEDEGFEAAVGGPNKDYTFPDARWR